MRPDLRHRFTKQGCLSLLLTFSLDIVTVDQTPKILVKFNIFVNLKFVSTGMCYVVMTEYFINSLKKER